MNPAKKKAGFVCRKMYQSVHLETLVNIERTDPPSHKTLEGCNRFNTIVSDADASSDERRKAMAKPKNRPRKIDCTCCINGEVGGKLCPFCRGTTQVFNYPERSVVSVIVQRTKRIGKGERVGE